MAQIASETAKAAAPNGSTIQLAQATPTVAETILPPMMDHGCASGLAGTAKSSTADAPMGATRSGIFAAGPRRTCIVPPVNAIPSNAPRHDLRRSGHRTAMGWGAKLESQRMRA